MSPRPESQAGADSGLDIVLAASLEDVTLIEASAGTGKTWTLAGLYLRLVIERGLLPENILVVTFTEAATAELRGRIRSVLLAAREAFGSGHSDDPLLAGLLARSDDRAAASRRLGSALRGFDLAAIQTIHAFCARVLADSAFESALPFDSELLADADALTAEVAADFWRGETADAHPLYARLLVERGFSPSELAARVARYLAHPPAHVDTATASPGAELWTSLEQRYGAFAQAWRDERDAIVDMLCNDPALAHRSYSKKHVPKWAGQLDALLAADNPLALLRCKDLERFAWSRVLGHRKGEGKPAFFGALRLCDELLDDARAIDAVISDLQLRFMAWAREALARRKRQRRVHTYDDLLLGLRDALTDPGGRRLANALRGRYPAALVDEFQDTDPVQYDIFRTIYAGTGSLFMVGDPKQAIYGFRGADIFAYLRAREDVNAAFSLAQNWRSVPSLVEALNGIYEPLPRPFLLDAIRYRPVEPAGRDHEALQLAGDDRPPLVLWQLPGDGATLTKVEATGQVAAACAGEVASLLRAGLDGRARIGERAVTGGDIAVIVRTHGQGARMREALEQHGIPVVEQGVQNVFDSREAREADIVLTAALLPGHGPRLRAALGTELVGFPMARIESMDREDVLWQHQVECFAGLHEAWTHAGPMTLLQRLDEATDLTARVLASVDAERRLTNLRHLFEMLEAHASETGDGPERQLQWFRRRRAGFERDTESEQLRLESDEQLVQIVTVHKAKGLEYPIVFCPFLWDGKQSARGDRPFAWHDPARRDELVLELGSERQDEARAARQREEFAESLRVAYVALTRAVHRCYLVWGRINQAESSPLAWLLFGGGASGEESPAEFATAVRKLDDVAMLAQLRGIESRLAGALAVERLPEPAPGTIVLPDAGGAYAARVFSGQVRAPWRMTSFTALTRRLPHFSAVVEQPDHDAGVSTPAVEAPPGGADIFGFPRGANPGTCLHSILEQLDFARPDGLDELVATMLERHGIDAHWRPVVTRHIEGLLSQPLTAGGPALADLKRGQRLDELEFTFPLRAAAARALRECLAGEPVEIPDFATLNGYLRGYIDLVFEHDGRFFVVDYKSNWLGPDASHYHRQAMDAVMRTENYVLQYLLYVLAVDRYLAARVRDYDYDRHFGGVYYLFLRGMTRGGGPEQGIWSGRPAAGLLHSLAEVFDGAP